MGGPRSTYGEQETCMQGLGGEPWWTGTTWKALARWQGNIEMDLQEV